MCGFLFIIWELEVQYGEFICVTCNLCVGMVEIFNLQLGLSLATQVRRASFDLVYICEFEFVWHTVGSWLGHCAVSRGRREFI
jgi:hypothetical protein